MRPAVARRSRPILTTLLLAVAIACSDDTTIGPGGIVLVRVVPDTFQLVVGKSLKLQGFPLDQKGGFVANRQVTWQTSDAAVATVSSNGTVTGVSIGTAQVTATAAGVSGTASVTVSPAPSIALSTDSVVLQAVAGSGATLSGNVAITNAGGVTLDSMALGTITFTQGAATGWLTASLNQPTAPATLSLSVSIVGLALGTYSATVPITAPSADNSPQTVTVVLTLTPGSATTMALQAGNNQTATVNATVATAPAVLITDQFGNPVPGQAVSFAVTAGGGSVAGGSAVSGANGIAAVTSWRLGTAAGSNGLSATAAGLAGSPVSFTATGVSAAAAQIAINAGNGQSAVAGQTLVTPPSVLVTDQFNNPVSGVNVTFAVASGGGSVIGAAQSTNPSGIATVGGWTLGTTAGANTMTATASGLGSPVTFTATGIPGPATTMAIAAGGTTQTATAGTNVAIAPAVKVTDANGNGVSGVAVTFAVATGGGSVTGGNATSGVGGVATVGSWRLGGTAGANTLTATSAGLTGSPATFSATGTTGPAAIIAVSAGNNQAASAGSPVPIAPAVIVTDINGNPVSGIGVTFAVASGGGSITGATPTTNTQGIAAVGSWTLGVTAGANSLTATSGGLTGSPVTFTATGNPGNAANMALNGGSPQTGTVGGTLATPISVLVTDNLTNPVQGVTVSWAAANGGSVNCGAGNVASCSSLTGVTGVAQATWTLGTAPGSQSATGSVGGLIGSPVNFTATANVGPATSVFVNAGNNQTATVNTAVATAPSVLVTDQFGNPVSGIGVTFTPNAGSGSVVGGSQTTAGGIATVGSWTLGTTAGSNTLAATAAGVGTVNFAATGTAGPATQIVINAGNNQTRTVNTAVLTPPSVVIRDAFNNPVGGVSVTFTPTAGGGSVTGGTQSSNAVTGVATVTSWTLGTVAGTNNNTLQASATVGSVNFTATATAGPPTSIAINSTNPQTATVNTAVGVAPSVIVRDVFSNLVPGATVSWLVTGGGGSVNVGTGGTTGAAGTATVTSWTVGTTAGASNNTLQASVSGAGNVSFTATANPGAPGSVTINSTNNQTVRIGTNVPSAPSVVVRDVFGNFVAAGTTVNWSIGLGGGSFVLGTGGSTNASGVATITSWTIQGGGTVNSNGTYTNQITATAGAVSNTITAFGRRQYSADIVPLMNANSQGSCQGCHTLSFIVYAQITSVAVQDAGCTVGVLVLPNDTTNSLLYRKVQHTQPAVAACGGPMPVVSGNPFLTAAERNVIRDWILNGAQNN